MPAGYAETRNMVFHKPTLPPDRVCVNNQPTIEGKENEQNHQSHYASHGASAGSIRQRQRHCATDQRSIGAQT
jgi:hypothetical protein